MFQYYATVATERAGYVLYRALVYIYRYYIMVRIIMNSYESATSLQEVVAWIGSWTRMIIRVTTFGAIDIGTGSLHECAAFIPVVRDTELYTFFGSYYRV